MERTCLEAVDGFDEALPSSIDHDFWTKLIEAKMSVDAMTHVCAVTYERHSRVTMTSDVDRRVQGIDMFLAKWTAFLSDWLGAQPA